MVLDTAHLKEERKVLWIIKQYHQNIPAVHLSARGHGEHHLPIDSFCLQVVEMLDEYQLTHVVTTSKPTQPAPSDRLRLQKGQDLEKRTQPSRVRIASPTRDRHPRPYDDKLPPMSWAARAPMSELRASCGMQMFYPVPSAVGVR